MLFGASALSPSDVWVVGDQEGRNGKFETLAEHWNGTTWSVVPTSDPGSSGNHLYAVDAVSPDNVWAVGQQLGGEAPDQGLVEHWDGQQWSVVPTAGAASRPRHARRGHRDRQARSGWTARPTARPAAVSRSSRATRTDSWTIRSCRPSPTARTGPTCRASRSPAAASGRSGLTLTRDRQQRTPCPARHQRRLDRRPGAQPRQRQQHPRRHHQRRWPALGRWRLSTTAAACSRWSSTGKPSSPAPPHCRGGAGELGQRGGRGGRPGATGARPGRGGRPRQG